MPEDTDRTLDADLGEQDAPDPGDPVDVTEVMPICKHCGQPISGPAPALHLAGDYRGKSRCCPGDSGLMYGYNAEPVGAACQPPCLGATYGKADHA